MEDIEDPYHVDVVEPGDRPRLAHGPLAHLTLLVGAQTRRQYQFLDRHVPPQRLVMSQPDAPHSALTERTEKPVPAGDAALVHGQHASPPTLSTPISTDDVRGAFTSSLETSLTAGPVADSARKF